MNLICNICGSTSFNSSGVKPRENAQCSQCKSLERHRAVHFFLNDRGFLKNKLGQSRCLQLAPEKVTHDYLIKSFGSGYIPVDLSPEKYRHAKCIKLQLPDGFKIFPDEYFDLIVHNHVLEHIPGGFKSHLDEFYRLLSPGGVMAFTIPDFRINSGLKDTIEDGEFLASDAERLRIHGQADHIKTFGTDLIEYLSIKFLNFEALLLNESDIKKRLRKDHNAYGIVFWCQK